MRMNIICFIIYFMFTLMFALKLLKYGNTNISTKHHKTFFYGAIVKLSSQSFFGNKIIVIMIRTS